jgi:uncharacterized membrane protein YeaQ/YmgE (transglycosylase-associated protein family)
MHLLDLILFGAAIGAIGNLVNIDSTRGFFGTVFLGILGATIGGTLANLLFGASLDGINFYMFLMASLITLVLIGLSIFAKKIKLIKKLHV